MPAKTQAQQRLFGMALAVRRGEMKRSEASEEVLKIVDSDMTDKQIRDFAKTKGLKESILESLGKYTTKYADKKEIKLPDNTFDHKVFIIIKPGFLNKSQEIIAKFEKEGFELYETMPVLLTLAKAKSLYKMHEKKDFYNRLCKYMSSGISIGMTFTYGNGYTDKEALKKTDAIKDWAREKWSEDDCRNVMHSSDSVKNMERETKIYF